MIEFNTSERQPKNRGQAMVEYALILVLMAIAFGVAIAASGPAIGNVFCNVVHNIGGTTASPQGGTCGSTAPDLAAEGGNPPLFWATVTWIAAHPQGETPFPTPIRRPPSGGSGSLPTNTPSSTPTPSLTPSQTPTPSPTPSSTPTNSATPGPSPTNADVAHGVPYVDQISKPEWWRLDTGDFTGYSPWTVQWYDATAITASGSGWQNIGLSTPRNQDLAYSYDINGAGGSWGSGIPTGSGIIGGSNTWGGDFNRTLQVAETAVYQFDLTANDYANVYITDVSNTTPIVYVAATGSSSAQVTLTAGTHNLRVLYADASGNASLSLTVTRLTVNPDDSVSTTCTWGRVSGSNDPVSVSWQFDNDPAGDSWASSQTCYLELRGYVDITGVAQPMLSFWEIWDLTGGSGLSVDLQVGNYELDGGGFLDRSALNWQTVNLHNAGANYNWTRMQVDLRAEAPPLNPGAEYVTLRFVISSGTGGSPIRWFIDDIQVLNELTPTETFSVTDEWDLETDTQMDDFIFDGDSNRTIAANPSLPNTTESWRWDLTSTHTHSGNLAWDDSPTGNYQDHSLAAAGVQRVHYLEFKYPIDLTPPLPPDNEGETGAPLLTFWHAFDIKPNASIRVQYTTDARDEVPDTWIDIPNQGVLIDYTTPTGPSRTNLVMTPVEIDLTNITALGINQFRLRFALYVDGAATQFGEGWYIDDIKIERQTNSPYFAFPFIDDAEDPTNTADWWDPIGGEWGATTAKGGAATSATAYADSPLAQYDPGDTQILQLHYAIDLNHDSPGNTAGGSAATSPLLTFWHQRSVNSGVSFTVDLWTPATGWDPIWTYDSASDTSFRTQNAWERVEINLVTALELTSGKSWPNITNNVDTILNDDDIKIRFVFAPGAATPADGVYIDEISIANAPTTSHKLWDSGAGGNGAYVDTLDDGFWASRWYHGGAWDVTNASGFFRTGSQALADSPSGNYAANTFSVMEMIPVIDMTGTTGQIPMLSFWTRYAVGSDDTFRVEIAYQDGTTAATANNYNQIGGWSAWQARPVMVDNSVTDANSDMIASTQVNTWQRAQVDLSSYVNKKIRVRFVMRVPNTTNQADGMYIDEVAFTYNPRQFALPLTDSAQNLLNWVAEGSWQLGLNYYAGTGTSTADFGATQWSGSYFDCEGLGYSSCGSTSTYTTILRDYPLTTYPANSGNPAQPIGPENIPDINFNWGTGNPAATNGVPLSFTNTFVARWKRTVLLSPGTYSFSTISDDGVRLWIDDTTGTNIIGAVVPATLGGGANSRYIINNWGDHSASLDYATFTVSSGITRVLTLEFYENGGDAIVILNATRSSFSFTDSPNPQTGCGHNPPTCVNGFSTVNSTYPGNSSLMLGGVFSLPSGTPRLEYQRLYDLPANNFFYVEVSTDGGFAWTQIGTETLSGSQRLPPSQYWESRVVPLSSYLGQTNVMVRFRLDTRGAAATGGVTGDGIYIASVRIALTP